LIHARRQREGIEVGQYKLGDRIRLRIAAILLVYVSEVSFLRGNENNQNVLKVSYE
jgi:hypothetical protein